MSTKLFEPSALFITFREAVEAGVIVSVSLAFLRKTNSLHLRKQVFWGVGAGLAMSVIVGIVILTAFYQFKASLFEGEHEQSFEGSVMLVACVMITVVAFAMLRMMYMHLKWEKKLENAANTLDSSRNRYALFLIAFTAVFREGLEAVIFITGVSQANPEAIPIPGLLGIVLGCIFSYLVFFGSKPMDIRYFIYISSFVMFAIGAGLLSRGIHEFQEMGAFGYFGEEESESTEETSSTNHYEAEEVPIPPSWANVKLGDFSGCCSAEGDSTSFYALLRAIFGYSDAPTRLEIITYMLYWGYVGLALSWKAYRGTLWGKFAPGAPGAAEADALPAAKQPQDEEAQPDGDAAATDAFELGTLKAAGKA